MSALYHLRKASSGLHVVFICRTNQEDLERQRIGQRVCSLVHKLWSSAFMTRVLCIYLTPLKQTHAERGLCPLLVWTQLQISMLFQVEREIGRACSAWHGHKASPPHLGVSIHVSHRVRWKSLAWESIFCQAKHTLTLHLPFRSCTNLFWCF